MTSPTQPLTRQRHAVGVHDDWFVTREVLDGVWEIAEPTHVYSWLLAGNERAVLLDTGLGIRPIRPVVQRLCDRPVAVVTTHYHFDHVGGHHEFTDIAIHQAGADKLAAGVPKALCEDYLHARDAMQSKLDALVELDRELALLTPDARPRPLPADFDRDRWTTGPSRATTLLGDGDVLDLGGRALQILHTPGHSPDGISIFDEQSGVLFAADAFNLGDVYCHFADSSISDLASSARRLAELGGSIRGICTHHYPRVFGEPSLLEDYADDLERLAAGEGTYTRGFDCFGYELQSAKFDYYAVTRPAPDAPPIVLHQPLVE
jgi:glyoxylase-like metal-dependent hydrolase (beta-lactamase superfamily II)